MSRYFTLIFRYCAVPTSAVSWWSLDGLVNMLSLLIWKAITAFTTPYNVQHTDVHTHPPILSLEELIERPLEEEHILPDTLAAKLIKPFHSYALVDKHLASYTKVTHICTSRGC